MDPSWNSVTTDTNTLNDIVQALGYNSVDQLPSVDGLTYNQVLVLSGTVSGDVMDKFYEVSDSFSSPHLDAEEHEYDRSELNFMLRDMQARLNNIILKFQDESAQHDGEQMKEKSEDRIKKLQDSIEKRSKAKNSSKASKWLGIAAGVLGVIVAAAVAVLTGGAAIALVGLAIAGLSLGFAAWQAAPGDASFDKCLEKWGVDDPKARMWIGVGITAAFAIGGLATGFGAAKAISSTAQAIKMGEETARVARLAAAASKLGTSVEAVTSAAKGVNFIGTLLTAFVSISAGGTGIDASVKQYDATEAASKAKELQALIQQLKSMMEEIQKEIKEQMQKRQHLVFDIPNDILTDILKQNHAIFGTSAA